MLNVNLLQLSSCSTAYGFRITHGHNPKGVQQHSEIGLYCTGTSKVLMGAYLPVKAPEVLSQSGPLATSCFIPPAVMTVKKQDSNQVLNL